MRIGLVGYGAWGRMHAGAIARLPELALTAVMCSSGESARAAAADLPGVTIYRSLDALLRDPAVDLVDIVVPNHLHAGMAVAALRSRVVGIEDVREAGEEGVRLKPEAFSRVLRHWEQEFSDEDMGTHIQNLMAVMVDSWKMEGGIFQKEEEPDTFEDDWGA